MNIHVFVHFYNLLWGLLERNMGLQINIYPLPPQPPLPMLLLYARVPPNDRRGPRSALIAQDHNVPSNDTITTSSMIMTTITITKH